MTDWFSASAMLVTGLIVGFMFIYGMKRREVKTDLERKDLEAKRDALIAQLRNETDATERARMERDAADVLKKLDHASAGQPPPPVATMAAPQKRATIIGFAWGAGSTAALVAIGYFVMQSAKPREAQPGPMQSGATQAQQPQAQRQPQQNDAAVKELEAAVASKPADLNARIELAKAYLDRENMTGVVEQTQYVLKRTPNDARALTYEALVRVANGQADTAKMMLQRATKSDPTLIDAWVGLAWVNAQAGNMAEAESAIKEAKRQHPEQAERLDALLQHIRPATPIRVTVDVAAGAKVPAGGLMFVIARAAGQTSGPPIAVKRVPVGAFPVTVEISSADSMNGAQLPGMVRIDVRIDSDGNPLTKQPDDLSAFAEGVATGQAVSMMLK